MDHQQDAEPHAQPEQNEAVFRGRVLGVVDEQRVLVAEDGLGLRKGDPVFALVLSIFTRVPLEAELGHSETYIQCTAASNGGAA